MNETFAVGQPLVPTVPVAAVASSSLRVGRCDTLHRGFQAFDSFRL